jgi:hypothetical protein
MDCGSWVFTYAWIRSRIYSLPGMAAFVFHISERMAIVSGRDGVAEAAAAGDDETDIGK